MHRQTDRQTDKLTEKERESVCVRVTEKERESVCVRERERESDKHTERVQHTYLLTLPGSTLRHKHLNII